MGIEREERKRELHTDDGGSERWWALFKVGAGLGFHPRTV